MELCLHSRVVMLDQKLTLIPAVLRVIECQKKCTNSKFFLHMGFEKICFWRKYGKYNSKKVLKSCQKCCDLWISTQLSGWSDGCHIDLWMHFCDRRLYHKNLRKLTSFRCDLNLFDDTTMFEWITYKQRKRFSIWTILSWYSEISLNQT